GQPAAAEALRRHRHRGGRLQPRRGGPLPLRGGGDPARADNADRRLVVRRLVVVALAAAGTWFALVRGLPVHLILALDRWRCPAVTLVRAPARWPCPSPGCCPRRGSSA